MYSDDERQHSIQRKFWIDGLREQGIKAAHPALVGADRPLSKPNFYYWNKDLKAGDRIALGNVGETPRIVQVKRIFTEGANPTKKLEYEPEEK